MTVKYCLKAAMTHVAQTTRDARINSSVTDLIESMMQKAITMGYGRNGLASVIEVLKINR